MGLIKLPSSGKVYLDTSPVIYGVEQVSPYAAMMQPIWETARKGGISLVSSELLLLETLVKPVRDSDKILEKTYREMLTDSQEIKLYPINLSIIEQAIKLRATYNLKTPDAIHAATAISRSCVLLITNDPIFRRISTLNVAILDEHI